jgi:hypothetical protein
MTEQRKTGGRHSPGDQPGTPLIASKGARLAMVYFRRDASSLC